MNSTVNLTAAETSTAYSFKPEDFVKMSACSFTFLVGVPTHFSILWHLIRGTESAVASVFFKLNVCFCEIGICVTALTYVLSYWFSNLTPFMAFFMGFAVSGRPQFQVLICVECYLAVVHPVTFLKYKPLRYKVICSSVVWMFTFGSCVFSMFILPLTPGHTWFFSVQFLLFLSIQLFCLVAVLRALKQSGPGERKKEENHRKRRAFHLILITTVTMVIIYVPFITFGFFTLVTEQRPAILWCTCLLCYLLAGFIQPVLYLQREGKLSCLCCKCN